MQIKIYLILFLNVIFGLMHVGKANSESAITYEFNGGRLGDNLASYAKAKWISVTYNIPLLYKPFPFSNQLTLHNNEKLFNKLNGDAFKSIIHLGNLSQDKIDKHANILYVSQWKTKIFLNIYTDKKFMAELKKLIMPMYLKEEIFLHKDRANIAMHVRTGGTFSGDQHAIKNLPLRFPPLQYYIDQLRKMYEIIKQPLYIYIFTDDSDPSELVKQFSKNLADIDIEFGYRKEKNSHKLNVIEDLFAMAKFDYLIRPGSHFSMWAQRLGNHKIIISPMNATWVKDTWVIDKVAITKK